MRITTSAATQSWARIHSVMSMRPGRSVRWARPRLATAATCYCATARRVTSSSTNITNATFLGTVGLDWQVMGFANFSSTGDTDMMLRNANTGELEVYDIRNNQIIGAS